MILNKSVGCINKRKAQTKKAHVTWCKSNLKLEFSPKNFQSEFN